MDEVKSISVMVPRTAFPAERMVKMRYSTTKGMGSTNLNAAAIAFRANSIYDPDYQILGHNPLGYNQWAEFYDQWIVMASSINVRFFAGDNDGGQAAMRVGVFTSDTPESSSGISPSLTDTWIEQEKGNFKILPPSVNVKPVTVNAAFDTKKWFNLVNVRDNLGLYGQAFSNIAPPTTEAYFNVWVGPVVPGGTSPSPICVEYLLEYIVLLSEPRDLASS